MTYRPQWQTVERYAYRFAAANHWRVKHVLDDPEDVLQECAVIFCKLCQIYGDTVDDPRWFMSLYKTALGRYFTSLARINKRRAANLAAAYEAQMIAPLHEEPSEFYAALATASDELQAVLRVIAVAPRDLLDLFLPSTPQSRWVPETEMKISRSWCRLAQLAKIREDLVSELRGLVT